MPRRRSSRLAELTTRSQAELRSAKGAAVSSPDLLAHVLQYVCRPELLRLRACSKAWRELVASAVRDHPCCRTINLVGATRERSRALARVFGPGCRHLIAQPLNRTGVKEVIRFAKSTRGLLDEVSFQDLRMQRCDDILSADLLALCDQTPQLKALRGLRDQGRCMHAPEAVVHARREATGKKSGPVWRRDALKDNVPYEVARRCPLLEVVELPCGPPGVTPETRLVSQAESWARHFPNIIKLDFGSKFVEYETHVRTALAAIAACPKVRYLKFTAVSLPGDTLLQLTSPYYKQLTTLDVSETCELSASVLLECVRNCEVLEAIDLRDCEPEDGASLATLGSKVPRLKRLCLGVNTWVDDDAMRTLFNSFECIEVLELGNIDRISDAAIIDLATSRSAATLERFDIGYLGPLDGSVVADLVDACPRLTEFTWEGCLPHEDWDQARRISAADVERIRGTIESRHGECDMVWGEEGDGSDYDEDDDEDDEFDDPMLHLGGMHPYMEHLQNMAFALGMQGVSQAGMLNAMAGHIASASMGFPMFPGYSDSSESDSWDSDAYIDGYDEESGASE